MQKDYLYSARDNEFHHRHFEHHDAAIMRDWFSLESL